MDVYRKGCHTIYRLHYHFVFTSKCRKPYVRGEVGERLRELIREICRSHEIEIVSGHVRPEHVHLLLSVPPRLALSRVAQAIKGKTSHHMLRDFRRLRRKCWGRHLWSRGYFVASSGNVTDEVLKKYIEEQDVEPQDGNFKLSE